MDRTSWTNLIQALPRNLTVEEVSRIFRRSETLTRRRLRESGYRFRAERKLTLPDWVGKADWSLPNSEIAEAFGLSRERVRQYRVILGKPKVENRGRKARAHAE